MEMDNSSSSNDNTSSPSVPTDVLKWMKADAKPEMALKLMQVSKRFRHKEFPYTVVKSIYAGIEDEIEYTTLNDEVRQWDTIADIPNNLWITLSINADTVPGTNFVHQLAPKIAVSHIRRLLLEDEAMFMEDFEILTASGLLEILHLKRCVIIDQQDNFIRLEQILARVPNVREVELERHIPSFTDVTAAIQMNLPALENFVMNFIHIDYDIVPFIEFMRDTANVRFTLRYQDGIYAEDIDLIQEFLNEFDVNDEFMPEIYIPLPI